MNIFIDKFKNKEYAYLKNTEFLVQTSKIRNGNYKTEFSCLGNLPKAIKAYENILSTRHYKKRIIMVGNLGETVIDVEKFL